MGSESSVVRYIQCVHYENDLLYSIPQMYYNYITGGFGDSNYGVAVSVTPQGPFTVANPVIELLHTDNGDENIFVDDDGTAYIIYTSLSVGHSISIERLTPDYLNSTLTSSGVFGETFVEVSMARVSVRGAGGW